MVAHYDIHFLECFAQSLYVGNCVVHCADVGRGSVMVPVAQEYTGLTIVCFGLFYEPYHECLAVVIVYTTVALESEVYVRETGYLLEKHISTISFLRLVCDWSY